MVKLNISSLRSEQIQSSLQYCAGGLSGQEKGKKIYVKIGSSPPPPNKKLENVNLTATEYNMNIQAIIFLGMNDRQN